MSTAQLRDTVAKQLRRSHAHAGLVAALDGFPAELAGKAVAGHPHTVWQQVEHLRLAAEDLVDYCRDPAYAARDWPAGYWPATPEPPSAAAWSASCQGALDATEQMARLVEDADTDLLSAVPAAEKEDHHALRAALILLDHNGYHAGQIVALRKALGVWPAGQASAP